MCYEKVLIFHLSLFCRPLNEMNDTKATNSTVDGEVNYKEDLFCWTIEGVGILVIGKVSLLGVDSLWGDCTFIPADWGS